MNTYERKLCRNEINMFMFDSIRMCNQRARVQQRYEHDMYYDLAMLSRRYLALSNRTIPIYEIKLVKRLLYSMKSLVIFKV
jgi:hypothetical protein